MPYGVLLDSSLNSMEEMRFKRKNTNLFKKLAKTTHFNETEVECILIIYYKLQKANPNKQPFTKRQLKEILHKCFDMTDDKLMYRIILAIDKSPSRNLSMEAWAKTMSVFLRGTLIEQINFCFETYDLMGDGFLRRETIVHLLRMAFFCKGGEEDIEESANDIAELLLKILDENREGKATIEDYKKMILKKPLIVELLGQCLPSRQTVNAFKTVFIQ